MKHRLLSLCLTLALLLAGCQLVPDQYVSEKPHADSFPQSAVEEEVTVNNYAELRSAFTALVNEGVEEATLTTDVYSGDIDEDFARLERHVAYDNPLTVYLVRGFDKEIVRAGSYYKINLSIDYCRDASAVKNIESVRNNDQLLARVFKAMTNSEEKLVLHLYNYQYIDFMREMSDYFENHLTEVMAKPNRIDVKLFPANGGSERYLEMELFYPVDAAELGSEKQVVEYFFQSAKRAVSELPNDLDRARRLYVFFINLPHGYSEESSPTPVFTLFFEGKTDSRTFSAVYNKVCEDAEVTCTVVHGTKDGEDYDWNILELESGVWHVDVNADAQSGSPELRLLTDAEMEGYEWDRDAYPECVGLFEPVQPEQAASDDGKSPEEQTPEAPEPEIRPEEPDTPPEPENPDEPQITP